jgi:hypothetical protein
MIVAMWARAVATGLVVAIGCGSEKSGETPPAPRGDRGSADTKVEEALADIVATTADVIGTVEVRRKGSPTWEKVAVGTTLRERDWVRTAKGSYARVRFGERGYVDLREDTTIIVDTAIQVETGTLTGQAGPGKDPLVVRAGDGSEAKITAAAGSEIAEFRVTPSKTKGVEIAATKGSLSVKTAGGDRAVGQGQASDVAGNKAGDVVQLLTFPKSVSPGIDARFLFVAKKSIKIAWKPVPGASRYFVQIAHDTEFHQMQMAIDTTSTSTTFIPDKPGMYAWRIAARDKKDRLGEYGYARRIFVEENPPKDLLLAPADGTKVGFSDNYPRIEFSWQPTGDTKQYKLVVGKGNVPTVDTVINMTTTEQHVEIGSLREGAYRWGVYAIRDGVEEPIFISPRVLTIRRQRVKAHTEKLWDDDKH